MKIKWKFIIVSVLTISPFWVVFGTVTEGNVAPSFAPLFAMFSMFLLFIIGVGYVLGDFEK